MKPNKDEYIDYSCSTPLERLARDVETLLRSWHIIDGSDRHVSFHRRDDLNHRSSNNNKSGSNGGNSNRNRKATGAGAEVVKSSKYQKNVLPPSGNVQSKKALFEKDRSRNNSISGSTAAAAANDGCKSNHDNNPTIDQPSTTQKMLSTPPRKNHVCANHGTTSSTCTTANNDNDIDEMFHTPGRTPARKSKMDEQEEQQYGDIQLIRSSKVILTTTPFNSNNPRDRIDVELELCLWDGPPTPDLDDANAAASSSNYNAVTSTTMSSASLSPLEDHNISTSASYSSSQTIKMSNKSPNRNQNQQKDQQNKNVPLSLISNRNHPPILLQKENTNTNLLSNLSHLFGIGQHITLSPTSQSTIESLLQSTMESLLHAQTPSRWNPSSSSLSSSFTTSSSTSQQQRRTTVEDEVALRCTALHSLSNQLQMVLNVATASCDCRIPAFGIWGLYKESVDTNCNNNSIMYSNASSSIKRRQKTKGFIGDNNRKEKKKNMYMLSQSMMDIPIWMNGGNLFNIASDSSSIGGFLQFVEKICKTEEEDDEGSNIYSPSRDGFDNDDYDDDDYSDEEEGDYDSSEDIEDGEKHNSSSRSPLRQVRRRRKKKAQIMTPPRKSFGRSSSHNSGDNQQRSTKQLYLPAFVNGNCHPGSSFYGIGASFAIHVVPPGVSYPIHCTTLNSLSQLLLQHCPSVSLSGLLKLQLASKSKSRRRSSFSSDQVQFEDRNIQGKIAVVCARHKYTWSDIFQYNEDYIRKQDELLLSSPSYYRYKNSWDELNILTYGLSWRASCEDGFGLQSEKSSMGDNEVVDAFIEYRKQCRIIALKRIYQALSIAKARRSRKLLVSKKAMEPLWGPTADPVTMVSVAVTWGGRSILSHSQQDETSGNGDMKTPPLLTLPLRIRSQNSMSSHDILEMENTILSTVFNPLSVPSSDFLVNISFDPDAACTTLSATNRCLLAALIRACTLESDTLMAHITNSIILEQLHDRPELDFVADEIMEKSSLSQLTRNLVKVMDWGSMADMMDDESDERIHDIIENLLQSSSFPSPPQATTFSQSDLSSMYNSSAQCKIEKGSPNGCLLSLLFTSMASLQTPSMMSVLWMTFVSELRLRWEQRERLENLRTVPGLDESKQRRNLRCNKSRMRSLNGLGTKATNASFLNCTEPDPDLDECLLNQKLQVFNIGVESIIALEMNQIQSDHLGDSKTSAVRPLSQAGEDISSTTQSKVTISIKDDGCAINDEVMVIDSDSCDFRSCGTRDEGQDDFCSVGPSSPRPDDVVLTELSIPPSPLRDEVAYTSRTDVRKGARCPVKGYSLVKSRDQLYAPYLQRAAPLTDDLLVERKHLMADEPSNTIQNRIETAHRLQKPKLLNDMSAFKAANPGCSFEDFTGWYGNPENPLDVYDDEDHTNTFSPRRVKSPMEEMTEACFVLTATRDFWINSWNEAEAIPASKQQPLFDAYSTVEMLLLSFESMHPSNLLNQILAVNLSTANFVLRSSSPAALREILEPTLYKVESSTNEALLLLSQDVLKSSKLRKDDNSQPNPFRFISSQTLAACERACTNIGEAETLLSRATSLLSKFNGDVTVVKSFMLNGAKNCSVKAHSDTSRSGILQSIYAQQQSNSGESFGINDLPTPSIREYILHNRDEKNPCQLTVCIGGTHGLEKGGCNSTKGGLVLALNKCVKGIQ